MIYLFTGSDSNKARQKAFAWVEAARKKAPEAPYMRIAPDEASVETLSSAASSSGLFFAKTLALVDDPFSLKESGEAVMESLKTLADSPNPIAILAPKLPAASRKKLEARAEKVFAFDAVAKRESRGFNAPLVNALGARDGTVLWLEIAKAMREGDAPEMIHGLLHWKARELMEKGSRAWTPAESRALSIDLIELLSNSRSESMELGMALERFALAIK